MDRGGLIEDWKCRALFTFSALLSVALEEGSGGVVSNIGAVMREGRQASVGIASRSPHFPLNWFLFSPWMQSGRCCLTHLHRRSESGWRTAGSLAAFPALRRLHTRNRWTAPDSRWVTGEPRSFPTWCWCFVSRKRSGLRNGNEETNVEGAESAIVQSHLWESIRQCTY